MKDRAYPENNEDYATGAVKAERERCVKIARDFAESLSSQASESLGIWQVRLRCAAEKARQLADRLAEGE